MYRQVTLAGAGLPGTSGSSSKANPAAPTPEWGLHLLDANLSLGNLIGIVKSETKAFARRG